MEVYNLVCEGGIEARIAGLVNSKRALSQGLFDGDSDEVRFDEANSFLERLEHIVDLPALPESHEDDPDEADELTDGEPAEPDRQRAHDPGLPGSQAPQAATPAVASQLAELAAKVHVEVERNGEVKLSAPPEVATAVAGFLEGLASQLRQVDETAKPSAPELGVWPARGE